MASVQQNTNTITLNGSSELVAEYLSYGINNILFQRGIYPSETFETVQYYGVTNFVSTDAKVKEFLVNILEQMKEWLTARKVRKISLVIKNISTNETVECWDFTVRYEAGASSLRKGLASVENCPQPLSQVETAQLPQVGNKDLKVIQNEIREVMRQISCSVTYLPFLDCPCSFDVLVYTFKDLDVPDKWSDTEPCFIANCQQVKLKAVSTSLHRMDTAVSYRAPV